ncbi:MAG: hypothetical protein HQM07_06415, partial [Zetaproteobacteria bacterium]|nr:hypothetical protein [Zetaproteobacteria bacterium]
MEIQAIDITKPVATQKGVVNAQPAQKFLDVFTAKAELTQQSSSTLKENCNTSVQSVNQSKTIAVQSSSTGDSNVIDVLPFNTTTTPVMHRVDSAAQQTLASTPLVQTEMQQLGVQSDTVAQSVAQPAAKVASANVGAASRNGVVSHL